MTVAVLGGWFLVHGKKAGKAILSALLMFALHGMLFTDPGSAADGETVIIADTVEHLGESGRYVAKGSVTVTREAATASADEMTYDETTGEVHASGNVIFDDPSAYISAEKADMHMERKTGTLFNAEIFFKKNNYHIAGREIERKGENEFFSRDQTRFTTCDGIPPAWCFRGRDIDLVVGERLKAKDTTFRIRDVPVFYTPYLYAPVMTERKTGFLMPAVGNSNTRGFSLNIPFFWAISENRDATFVLDLYTKRGFGKGLEYRFVEPGGIRSDWWFYHIRDTELDRDFAEVRALHENRTGRGAGWYLDINYVNEQDFYREFNPHKEKQILRFLQSTGELSIPFDQSRLYFLAQYWVDLAGDRDQTPQKLPALGFVLHPTRIGPVLVSADTSAINIWREQGISARRIDVYPRLLHSIGSDLVFTQTIAARGTAYAFFHNDDSYSNTVRAGFEYDGNIHTRFYRKYGAYTHVVEPMVRYHFISSSDDDLPVFDQTELFKITSRIELSVLNRIISGGKEIASLRITQPVDTYQGDRPFMPLQLDIGMSRYVPLKVGMTVAVNTVEVKTLSSELAIPFKRGTVSFEQRYNRDQKIEVYKAGLNIRPVKALQLGFDVWYDREKEEVTNLSAKVLYMSQCWGVRFTVSQTPEATSFMVMIDLYGVTADQPSNKTKGLIPWI